MTGDTPDPSAAPEDPAARFDERGHRLCRVVTKSTGLPCGNRAIPGGFVCRHHGGSLPQTAAKARVRLAELVSPAIALLARELVQADKSADRQRAANSILDRAGYARVTRVEDEGARDRILAAVAAVTGQDAQNAAQELL